MEENKKVSIVMPTYNQTQFIKEAVDSILNQEYQNWEFIIINDGSTDNTAEIIKSYLPHPKIKYFEKENGGTGSALNYGLKYASGEYETYVSSDNIYFSNFLSVLIEYLEKMPNVGFIYSDFQFIDKEGNLGPEILRPVYVKGMLLYGCVTGLCFMWRAVLRKRIGGFDERFTAQDYDFALKCEEFSNLYHIPMKLGYYRDHAETVSNVKGYDDTVIIIEEAKKRRGLS
ncbi:MAG: glycosyltransferase [Halanaerobiales bacterium]|nr:glycosyltransferase [Halanaerobiales bacterium]